MSKLFKGIKTISLTNPHFNGVPEDNEKEVAELKAHVETINEISKRVKDGERIYLGITSGERKGSIAYVHDFDGEYQQTKEAYTRHENDYWGHRDRKLRVRAYDEWLSFIIRWDPPRRNKIKWCTMRDTVWLPDYEGPTVWEKFDKKAAAKKALETPILDRENNELKVGDKVLYINARYGCGASLDRGTVEEIKATVQIWNDEGYSKIHVIIKNDDGEKSDIKEPQLSVIKLDSLK